MRKIDTAAIAGKVETVPTVLVPQVDYPALFARLEEGPMFLEHSEFNTYKALVVGLRQRRPEQSLSFRTVFLRSASGPIKAFQLTLHDHAPQAVKPRRMKAPVSSLWDGRFSTNS